MAEVFVTIAGYPNYKVSNFGNVKSITTQLIMKGTKRSNGYFNVSLTNNEDKSNKTIHRLVANAFIDNPLEKKNVDHIDHNRLNNHVSNLRWATSTENNQNRSMHSNNKSGITGVIWNKERKKWRAYITKNKVIKYIGCFINKEDAIRARQEAEVLHFQEFRAV